MGTDWPVPVIRNNNPFPPLADALERSKQGIDIETGIRMLTINGAITIGAADSTGSIEVGKSADFIVLDRNLLESSTERIRNTRVLETVFEGKTVYSTDTRTAELEDYKSFRSLTPWQAPRRAPTGSGRPTCPGRFVRLCGPFQHSNEVINAFIHERSQVIETLIDVSVLVIDALVHRGVHIIDALVHIIETLVHVIETLVYPLFLLI